MSKKIIIDAGSLVALLNKKDHFHSWANQEANNLPSPFFTCEAVITEACFLLHDVYGGEDAVMILVKMGKIQIPFQFSEEVNSIQELIKCYQSVPMSFADACVVRMSKLIANNQVFTIDSDFYIYRKNKKEMIPLIIPN